MIRKSFTCVACIVLAALQFAAVNYANAQEGPFRVAGAFGDHMVLQRDRPIPIWGWAAPGQEVSVSIADRQAKATANDQGRWMVKLDSLPAGGPHQLIIQGKQTIKLTDILVGEVWLCSGQSNMAMTVARSQDFEKEKLLADRPRIRMMTVVKNSTPELQQDCKGNWVVASSDSVGKFSATAWFFGRKLNEELNVPIGLINSSWGGTDVAAWTSRSAQETNETLGQMLTQFDKRAQGYDSQKAKLKFDKAMQAWEKKASEQRAAGKKVARKPRLEANPMKNQNRPSNLFNGMINPLVPFGIRGVIWYQGERNAKSIEAGELYAEQLKLMINDWRNRWGARELPFITVQLPNFHKPTDAVQNTGWVMVRESQWKSLELKNTGIAVTTDVGMANDIHPKNKQVVGQRLALWALGTTYQKDIVYSGPLFKSIQFDGSKSEGNRRGVLSMNHIGDGLKARGGDKDIKGFVVAGKDRVFYSARATYDAQRGKIIVSCEEVPDPIAVRYNWSDNPSGNLVNSADLPAAPFRTDTWKINAD